MTTSTLEAPGLGILPELAEPEPLTVPYTDIPVLPWEWLWEGFLPLGVPVLWAAPGGTGKGLAIARIVAIVTTGGRFPGDPADMAREPGSCVIVAPEDDCNRVTSPRLDAAGADKRFVHDLSVLPGDEPFMWPAAKDKLRTAIREINKRAARSAELGLDPGHPDYMVPVAFVSIDPLYRTLEKDITNRAAALRLVIPLESICREFNVAMVVSHHTTKDGKTVSGSKALTDAFRAVFLIGRDPDERRGNRRVFTVFKANIVSDRGEQVFEVAGQGAGSMAVFTEPQPPEETPEQATSRLRVTTADLQRQDAGRAARTNGQSRLTTADLGGPQDGPWKLMRRISDHGKVSGGVAGSYGTEELAREAASLDKYSAGHGLAWSPAAGKPEGWSMARFSAANGASVSYLVYPGVPAA